MTNSADSDQLASSEANWSGSTLFDKTGHVVFSKRRLKWKFSILKSKINPVVSHPWTVFVEIQSTVKHYIRMDIR